MENKNHLQLSNDPLANIHIMAPLLSEKEQASVYGLIYGLIMSADLNEETKKEATRKDYEKEGCVKRGV